MDVERSKALTARLDITGIDFAAFERDPLAPEPLRCLRYMHDVEIHTICYLRDLLVTRAHRDPAVTSFLTFWAFEEFWHGDAIATVLQAHGEATENRVSDLRETLGWKDKIAPYSHLLGSMVAGESFIAIHMTWGAINEWTTQASYARLAAKADHPVLGELLRRIMRQEGRHIDFYAAEATRRLQHDRRAQRLTRFTLQRLWSPVGSSIMPTSEVDFMADYLWGDEEGEAMAARIDRRVDRLPGLADVHPMARSWERSKKRRQHDALAPA